MESGVMSGWFYDFRRYWSEIRRRLEEIRRLLFEESF